MTSKKKSIITALALSFLFMGMTAMSITPVSASSGPSVSVGNVPASAHGLSKVANPGISPSKTVPSSVWAGYGAAPKVGGVFWAVNSFIVPSVKCDPSAPSYQAAFYVTTLDALSGSGAQAGLLFYCATGGAPKSASYFLEDPMATYGPINASDSVYVIVDYNYSCPGAYGYTLADLTAGTINSDCSPASAAAQHDTASILWTASGADCGVQCPLPKFKPILVGAAYTGVVCTGGVADVDTPCYADNGANITYPLGATGQGKVYKFVLTGIAAPVLAKPTGLQSDFASHTIKFVNAGP